MQPVLVNMSESENHLAEIMDKFMQYDSIGIKFKIWGN